MDPAIISIVLLFIFMVLYISEIFPIAIVALASCVVPVLLGIATTADAWYGFSSNTMLLIAGMTVVGISLIETNVALDMGNYIFNRYREKPEIAAFAILIVCMILSAFMNNTAAAATMIPVMGSIVVASKGHLHEKRLLLPLGVIANIGGMLTLIGTTPQLVAQEAMVHEGLKGFGFFDTALLGIPIFLVFTIYYFTLGKYIANKLWADERGNSTYINYIRSQMEKKNNILKDAAIHKNQVIAVSILIVSVLLMVITDFPTGTIAIGAALLTVILKCTTVADIYKNMDWTTLFVLGGGMGFANIIGVTGGGQLIVDTVTSIFGVQLSAIIVLWFVVIISAVLTLFMSNTAVAALMVPIGLSFANELGMNPYTLSMGIAMAANSSFSTPVATPSMTMLLGPGDYNFKEYIYWCLPLNIICILVVLIITPLIWQL